MCRILDYTLIYLLPLATMVTVTDVEVLELCTKIVARIPIMRPVTGLDSSSLCVNTLPVRPI